MWSYSFQGNSRVWKRREENENWAIFSGRRQETNEVKIPLDLNPIYFGDAEHEIKKWPIRQLMRLLRFYAAHRCLWDVTDVDNRNRKLRKAALIDITAAMGDSISQAQVKQKINVLRTTYRYEKRRIKQRIRKGIGPKTKLKWFALADAFLRNVPRTENSRRKEIEPDTDSDLEDIVVLTIEPESMIQLDENEQHMDTSSLVLNQVTTEFSDSEDEFSNASAQNELTPAEKVIVNESLFVKDMKKVWTANESIKFVNLLKSHPVLWQIDRSSTDAEKDIALCTISNVMQIPVDCIQKKVDVFCKTIEKESLKICEDRCYKPNYVWWSIAETFIFGLDSKLDNFVDANGVFPETPVSTLEHIKEENYEMIESNPIPSVALSCGMIDSQEDGLVTLFNDSNIVEARTDREDSLKDDCSSGLNCTNSEEKSNIASDGKVSETKLIWNGLEDDLLEGKWSLKHSVKFLRLYGAHRCLWDLQDPDYRSRELRNAAIEDIAAAMGFGLDANYVAKKIRIFRITYMQHRKRMLEAIKDNKEPEIQLRWFPLADSFLRPHIGLRSIKENEREMPQFNFQYVCANLNLIDPALLTDFRGKGTQNIIDIG